MSTIATTNIKEPSSATNNITLTSGGDTTISGNATVTGTLTFPPNAGQILQVVNFQTGEYNSGTTVMPVDNTIPQNTEGDEYMTLTITPTSATSKLLIEISALLGPSAAKWIVGAIFQDTTADALAGGYFYESNGGAGKELTIRHYMTAGTTSATTFKFRAGVHTSGGTLYFNGSNARYLGGVAASSITITEIAT